MATFGETMRQLKEKSGLTSAEIAQRTGANIRTVEGHVSGRAKSCRNTKLLLRYAALFGVKLTDLAADDEAIREPVKRALVKPKGEYAELANSLRTPLGKLARKCRERSGFLARQVGASIGSTEASVSRAERNERFVTLEMLLAMVYASGGTNQDIATMFAGLPKRGA
jgi:transcriptional regulator with XRE-family HTH domain